MKFFILIIFIVKLISYADNTLTFTQAEKEFIKKNPVINLATSYGFEPYIISNPNGTVSGYDKDLLNIIEEETGLTFHITFGNWDEMHKKTLKSEFYGFGSGGFSEERKKFLNHSTAYLKFATFVITKKDNPLSLRSVSDLKGKTVSIQKGNLLFSGIIEDLNQDIKILWVDSIFEMLNAVLSNRADFTILDESVNYLAKMNGLQNAIETTFTIGKPFELYFWFNKEHKELVSIFNKVLLSLNAQQKMQLRDKWFKAKEEFDYELFFKILGTMFIALLFLSYRYYLVNRHAEELEEQQKRLEYQANYDSLTGLPNLLLSNDRIEQAIKNAKRNKHHMALLFIDLDHFKVINDRLGHKAGDEVLRISSQRLLQTIRTKDTVARIGGDEFVIVLDDLLNREYAGVVAKKVLNSLEEPMLIEGKESAISCSIGISIFPEHGKTRHNLIRHADLAMYRVKKSGKNGFEYYDEN